MKLMYLEFASQENKARMSILTKLKILLQIQKADSSLFLEEEVANLRNELTNKMKEVDESW